MLVVHDGKEWLPFLPIETFDDFCEANLVTKDEAASTSDEEIYRLTVDGHPLVSKELDVSDWFTAGDVGRPKTWPIRALLTCARAGGWGRAALTSKLFWVMFGVTTSLSLVIGDMYYLDHQPLPPPRKAPAPIVPTLRLVSGLPMPSGQLPPDALAPRSLGTPSSAALPEASRY